MVESPIFEPGFQVANPGIRTYAAVGIDDQSAYMRFDITQHGFHAMIRSPHHSTIFIDPHSQGDTEHYLVYYKSDFTPFNKEMSCKVQSIGNQRYSQEEGPNQAHQTFGDCSLRTYRIAIAATGEYTAFHGGTVANASAAIVTTMNRVNGVYEQEMAIRMNIVANNNDIVYDDASNDPYTNGNPGAMIDECQTNCDNVIGSANYDIGHVFGTNSGGVAGLGVVCNNSFKGRGVTGSAAPIGDPFDIDYVCHEIGHQFGANHTQNNDCNRNNSTAYEPGSASTIMGYAGICSPDVQSNSDDYFHAVSLQEISDFITAPSHTCPVQTTLTNASPTITQAGGNVSIPASTPFALTCTATDPDNDALTYCWEQYENDVATMPPVATSTAGPNFRTFDPSTSPTRFFPNLADLSSGTPTTWEVLPSVARTMTFRVTVRDNAPGGGCTDDAIISFDVDDNSGPFVLTYPSATGIAWPGSSNQNVTWNVAGTDLSPVNCSQVDLFLSTDGGLTYPIVVATNIPNTGSASIIVPNTPTTTARIMARAAGNIFFDISDNDFTITAPVSDYNLALTPTTQAVCPPADAVFTVNVGSTGGFTDPVTLSASNLPPGTSATFSPNPVTPGNPSTLTISNTSAAPNGTYLFAVSGQSTTGQKTINGEVNVANAVPATVVFSAPSNGATGISTTDTLTWNAVPGSTYEIDIATDANFNSIVQNATGLITNSYPLNPALSTATTYFWRVPHSR